jgi:site-specific recombinase XerD
LKRSAPCPDVVDLSPFDFAVLTVSWELALRADGYADNTVKAYQNAVRSLAGWLAEHHPEMGPAELERQHIRGWLVEGSRPRRFRHPHG